MSAARGGQDRYKVAVRTTSEGTDANAGPTQFGFATLWAPPPVVNPRAPRVVPNQYNLVAWHARLSRGSSRRAAPAHEPAFGSTAPTIVGATESITPKVRQRASVRHAEVGYSPSPGLVAHSSVPGATTRTAPSEAPQNPHDWMGTH